MSTKARAHPNVAEALVHCVVALISEEDGMFVASDEAGFLVFSSSNAVVARLASAPARLLGYCYALCY